MKISGDSCIVKKQNTIAGLVIVLQVVVLSLFACFPVRRVLRRRISRQ
jgi:hypothetical protein